MKAKKNELTVDVIGGAEPLTKAEEKALCDFFSKRKSISKKATGRSKNKTAKKVKASA
jgi:hypothetical protein